MLFLRTCCCGCTLKTGSLIIGSLSLIASAASLILMILVIPIIQDQHEDNIDGVLKYETKHSTSKILTLPDGSGTRIMYGSDIDVPTEIAPMTNGLIDTSSDRNYQTYHRVIMTRSYDMKIIITYMIGSSISTVVSILLIVGAVKGYMWLLLPWIAYMSLSIIVAIISSIYQLVTLTYFGASGGSVFLAAMCVCLVLVLYFYLLMVVISHFEELRRAKRESDAEIGKIYMSPNPWMSSNANILPNLPEKDGA